MGKRTKTILKSAVIALFLLSSAFVIFGMNPVSAAAPTTPDAPTGLTAVSGINQVTLTWTAPAFNGGGPIDYYIVYQDGVEVTGYHPAGLTTTIAVQYVYQSRQGFAAV